MRVKALEIAETFETLVDPGVALPPTIARLTGLRDAELRARAAAGARRPAVPRVRRRRAARRAQRPLRRRVPRPRRRSGSTGRRVAAPVVDTVWLARRLLHRRSERFSLSAARALLRDVVRSVPPRAPGRTRDGRDPRRAPRTRAGARRADARRGDRARRAAGAQAPRASARSIAGAPTTPGVYLFRDRNDTVLYVGKARDLRARLRSYFAGDRQRPGRRGRARRARAGRVARARVGARGLARGAPAHPRAPPAGERARRGRPQSYLERRGDRWAVVSTPTRFGPIASKRRAQLAARALGDFDGDDLAAALPPLRARLPRLARDLRFEDAARLRDRVAALEEVAARVDGARSAALGGALHPRARARAGVLARVLRRARPRDRADDPARRGGTARDRGRARRGGGTEPSLAPEDAADLLVVAGFLRKPPPELRIVGLALAEILAA